MTQLESQIIDLIKKRQHDKVDGLWLQYIEAPSGNLKFYKTLASLLGKSKHKKRLNDFGVLLIDGMLERGEIRQAIQVARIFLWALPERCEFLPQVLRCVRELNRNRPRLEEYIERAAFDEERAVGQALTRLDVMIYNDEGEVFEHDIVGFGKVILSDPDECKVLVAFENGEEKEFTFEGTREYLHRIPAGHFHALRMKDAKRFRELAFSKPVEFLKVVLRSFNRKLRIDNLRSMLTSGLMSSSQWQRWWRECRDPLMHDPYLEYTGGARGTFRLRETPRKYHEDLIDRFREEKTTAARAEVIREAHKQFAGKEPLQAIIGVARELLLKEYEELPADDVSRHIAGAYLWEDLHANEGEPIPGYDESAALGDPETVGERVLAIVNYDYQCRALERFAGFHAETWPRYYTRLLLESPPKLAAWLVRQLDVAGHHDLLSGVVEKLLVNVRGNIEGCLWGLKQYFDGKWSSFFESDFPQVYIVDLLDEMERLYHLADQTPEKASQLRGTVAKIRNFLWADHCTPFVKAIQALDIDDVRQLLTRIQHHPAVSGDFSSQASSAFRQTRNDLVAARDETKIDDSVLYVSAQTLAERRKEYEHLNSVEIPKNSQAIGEAAALGDLSENAEYVAAKEHQKVLHSRLEELGQQLLKARVIDSKNSRTDMVTVGVRFTARNVESDEEVAYSLMGIWDARPQHGVLSYLSPLARQFYGKRAGQQVAVTTPDGVTERFKILRIEKAEELQPVE